MSYSILALSFRSLCRDFRSGQFRLLMLALILAVASLSSVGFFSDRFQAGLDRDARKLLGGDAVMLSDQPLYPQVIEKIKFLGLKWSQTVIFPTMARPENGLGIQLVALKAVSLNYPLIGQLQTASGADKPMHSVENGPAFGEVWVDPLLQSTFNIKINDFLLLGEGRFKVTQFLIKEPDRGSGFLSFSPRVMMNLKDLDKTQLIQPASRVRYRTAVVGSKSQVEQFVIWGESAIEQENWRGVRLEVIENGRPEISQTLDRAKKFLNLVALLSALLSAVAVALASRDFANKHLDDCAMLRVLGLSQRSIAWNYSLEFMIIGCIASLIGVGVGFLGHHTFIWLLGVLVDATLPASSWQPAFVGFGIGVSLLIAFGIPPILQLASVPALRVIRRDLGSVKPVSFSVFIFGILGFIGILLVVSQDITLGAIAVGGFFGAAFFFGSTSWVVVKFLRRSVSEKFAPRWLILATRQLSARPIFTMLQVGSLAIGLMALVLLFLIRTDLVSGWRQSTPTDMPNRFVINIMPDQSDSFKKNLQSNGVSKFDWYPMVRGRLIAINEKSVKLENYAQGRAQQLIDRDFNLSYSSVKPEGNDIVAGRWLPGEKGAISVEQGIAKTLGLKIGDVLLFDMGGVREASRITSLRKVNWVSLRANFFVIYPVDELPLVSATFLSAFLAPNREGFDSALVQEFPNITNVNMSSTIAQIQAVLGQVVSAVEFLFVFTVASGLIVLLAVVAATRQQRSRDFAIMRSFGASSKLLSQIQTAELLGVGMLAGFLAGVVSCGMAWALAYYAFNFDWSVTWWTPVYSAIVGALWAWLSGLWSLREILKQPVVQTLRNADF